MVNHPQNKKTSGSGRLKYKLDIDFSIGFILSDARQPKAVQGRLWSPKAKNEKYPKQNDKKKYLKHNFMYSFSNSRLILTLAY